MPPAPRGDRTSYGPSREPRGRGANALAYTGRVDFSVKSKLMGQVNLIRQALRSVREGGSVAVTSGVLAQWARFSLEACGRPARP
jgi:hypothetical protein